MLSTRLSKLRKDKGLSQYEMAKRLGFSRGQLANYEQGTRAPDLETLQKIADFFEVTVDYLLGRFTIEQHDFIADIKSEIPLENLVEKYNLTIKGKPATKKEIEEAIKYIEARRIIEEMNAQ
jgi:transcriptional regulator with XRE-family HTH domain